MEKHFFYHNFPRGKTKDAPESIEHGIAILESIRDMGLLLVPQVIDWIRPPRRLQVIQKRIRFTSLKPKELIKHAEKFGYFALEFDANIVRSLGATPVFYIPQHISSPNDGSLISLILLEAAIDARNLIERIHYINDVLADAIPNNIAAECKFGFTDNPEDQYRLYLQSKNESLIARTVIDSITYRTMPIKEHLLGMEALLKYFCPADDMKNNDSLGYYHEREWRIACEFKIHGKDIMRQLTPPEKERIFKINPTYFGKILNSDHGPINMLDEARIHSGINSKSILELTRRVIVPASAIDRVKEILGNINSSKVVSIEDIE